MAAVLIFPHQLFHNHPAFNDSDQHIILVEDPLFFGVDEEYPVAFHRQKLMLHRASMQAFGDVLRTDGKQVTYLEVCHDANTYDTVWKTIATLADTVHIADVVDDVLRQRIKKYSTKQKIRVVWHDTPNFYLTKQEVDAYFTSKKVLQHNFYKKQRQTFDILMNDHGKPVGGTWSFDAENRNKLKKEVSIPDLPPNSKDPYLIEARAYIEAHFKDNPGSVDYFIYPVTRNAAKEVLQAFFEKRFAQYGTYQDAMTDRGPFLFHSLLSSSINIGLLNPKEVVDAAIAYAEEHDVPLNALEGFIRQILGWREYMRGVYESDGRYQRTKNFFGHTNKLAACWYTAETGIAPLDDVIKKTETYCYAHHIERLMIVGNLMLLCEIDPDEVYRWFMELFIDAYDWVMVPNVYGMSQYADGGRIITKPYISSSNYIRKMSDYKKGDWCEVWDALYWRFVAKHRDLFESNARMKRMTYHLDRFGEEKVAALTKVADAYIAKLTK